MGNPNGLRVLILLLPAILLFCSAALIAIIEQIAQDTLDHHLTRDFIDGTRKISLYGPFNSSNPSDTSTFTHADVRLDMKKAPHIVILGVDLIAFGVSILAGCAIWELRRVEGAAHRQRVWAWFNMVLAVGMVAVSAGALGWASALVGGEKRWTGYADVLEKRSLTRETLDCQIDAMFPQEDWAGAACGLEKTMRFMLIVFAISAGLLLVSTWILVRERGGVSWLMGGKGKYGAFESVYEMNPHGGPTPAMYPQQVPYVQQGPYVQLGPQFNTTGPPYPPAQFQSAPPMQKDGALAQERPVFR